MRRVLVTCLCLRTLAALAGTDVDVAGGRDTSGPRPSSLAEDAVPWAEVRCPAYTAKINTLGCLRLELPDGTRLDGSLVRCWRLYQRPEDAKLPRVRADRNKAILRYEYLWNGGRVVETLRFTCRSIAVDYEYCAPMEMDISWFTYCLRLDLKDRPVPELTGGLWRLGEQCGVVEVPDWDLKRRFSSLALGKPWPCRLDLLAEHDNWLSAELKEDAARFFIWDKGRWASPQLPSDTPLRLGILLWFSTSEGNELPGTVLEFVP